MAKPVSSRVIVWIFVHDTLHSCFLPEPLVYTTLQYKSSRETSARSTSNGKYASYFIGQ